jgi:hypothetical protein
VRSALTLAAALATAVIVGVPCQAAPAAVPKILHLRERAAITQLGVAEHSHVTDAYGGVIQIDHTVPVENVWISGAWRWTKATRVRYYNDLRDPRTLVGVDAYDNESKGDQDPTTWLPADGRCRYVRYWVAVKARWHLSVTRAEKTKLAGLAGSCPNRRLTITKAAIGYR